MPSFHYILVCAALLAAKRLLDFPCSQFYVTRSLLAFFISGLQFILEHLLPENAWMLLSHAVLVLAAVELIFFRVTVTHDGALLSWEWLNTCLPMESGE